MLDVCYCTNSAYFVKNPPRVFNTSFYLSDILNMCMKIFFGEKIIIRKTYPCIEYPLKPHFYIVKLGYAGVYLFFLFLLQNIDCGYSLEPPRQGGSNLYPQSMF